jgi:hypothetical protein
MAHGNANERSEEELVKIMESYARTLGVINWAHVCLLHHDISISHGEIKRIWEKEGLKLRKKNDVLPVIIEGLYVQGMQDQEELAHKISGMFKPFYTISGIGIRKQLQRRGYELETGRGRGGGRSTRRTCGQGCARKKYGVAADPAIAAK